MVYAARRFSLPLSLMPFQNADNAENAVYFSSNSMSSIEGKELLNSSGINFVS